MKSEPCPRIVVSKCLEFARCRYDGEGVSSELVRAMMPFVDFLPVCPELEIGLGVPRDPIRIVSGKGKTRLMQPSTGKDLTRKMQDFAARFLGSAGAVDGFILKARSPSCGIRNAKVFPSSTAARGTANGQGFFAAAAVRAFPLAVIEDEDRLLDSARREHFLTRAFTAARFRAAQTAGIPQALNRFHAEHRLLLMTCNADAIRRLGRIAANLERRPMRSVLTDYQAVLNRALATAPRRPACVNVLMHALDCLKTRLAARDKSSFLKLLKQYQQARVPLSAPVGVVQSWIVRFADDYLARQAFFRPYPQELALLKNTSKSVPARS
jgi:uncharacterized protein YbbK (DUF523 family)/uncharacterized protein YbgA (DUF1722 family)